MTGLRVMSYNLKSLELDAAAAGRVIRAADPDVVCVQETVRWLFGPWRMARFARSVGMAAVVNTFRARGTGILVRASLVPRVTRARGVALDGRAQRVRRGWPTPRGYAELRIRVPGAGHGLPGPSGEPELTLLSVHMSIVPARRARHLPMLRRVIRELGPARLVLAGDLNEPPGGDVWSGLVPPLRDGALDVTGVSGVADTSDAPDAPGPSTDPCAPTFPAVRPKHRIDALLVGEEVRVTGFAVLHGADVERGSDHCPVVATVDVAP